jgi:predicted phosphodiesterase
MYIFKEAIMILFFSDIHASKVAAQYIESIAKKFNYIVCAGDICGFGRDFKYCIDMFKSLNIKSVLGNHDRMVISGEGLSNKDPRVKDSIEWTRERISLDCLDYLWSLPRGMVCEDTFVIHTYPGDRYIKDEGDCVDVASLTTLDTIFVGHTHVQGRWSVKGKTVVNLGSITQGRKGNPRGYVTMAGSNIKFVQLGEL